MNDHQRARRLDRRTAERLLRSVPMSVANGPADHRADGYDALRALLAAAAGPPRPGELAGEDAAAAAFRTALARPAPHRPRWAAVSRFATVKVAVLAAALAAFGGGVAVAASTGHLPGQSPAPASSHHRSPKQSSHRRDRLMPSPTVAPRTTPPPRHQKPSPSPKGTPKRGRTTPPGQAKSRSPKAKKTHPSKGQGNNNGNGKGKKHDRGDGVKKNHGARNVPGRHPRPAPR
ncbi:hypothetical protein F8568_014005 [Actinomadura sp. LD22]|uniref:Uncharacterized protein n=1 Tax=Actinomadura physcomitrii TaxID=2650748 RepID=A0A6I4M6R9_9ACTN|nr:hypothetical protein [Actinomadura physcomitrii]MWA01473.1 hypothetical protein [Actinomadura physcomitrii]